MNESTDMKEMWKWENMHLLNWLYPQWLRRIKGLGAHQVAQNAKIYDIQDRSIKIHSKLGKRCLDKDISIHKLVRISAFVHHRAQQSTDALPSKNTSSDLSNPTWNINPRNMNKFTIRPTCDCGRPNPPLDQFRVQFQSECIHLSKSPIQNPHFHPRTLTNQIEYLQPKQQTNSTRRAILRSKAPKLLLKKKAPKRRSRNEAMRSRAWSMPTITSN